MKARQDFEICVDKEGNRLSFTDKIPEGAKLHKFKVGDEVPKKFLGDLLTFNSDYLDVKLKDGEMVLPEGIEVDKKAREKVRSHIAKNPKYSQEGLYQKLNKMGFKAFREWAKKKFEKFKLTDRSGRVLIVEILNLQETLREKGEYLG